MKNEEGNNHYFKIISELDSEDLQILRQLLSDIRRKIKTSPLSFDMFFILCSDQAKDIFSFLINKIPLTDFYSFNNPSSGIFIKNNSDDLNNLMLLWEDINKVNKIESKSEWCWLNKRRGIYQFGEKTFKQTGNIRKKVFIALMDIYEKSPDAISISSVKEMTNEKSERIRIEISAINRRLSRIEYYFKGSGKGFYTLEKTS